tara:strand:- start:275 stop:883 length:609 start_codon:yes stop_codon:yes gene_type:complete
MTTSALPKVSLDSTFKLGQKKFTLKSAMEHAVACYDKLYLIQEDQLALYREMGNILLQIESLFSGDKTAFGNFLKGSELSNENISSADKYDAKWIATHWTKVQQLNKAGKLSALGVSSIRKIVLEAHPELRKKPKADSAGNTSKGKPKAAAASKEAEVQKVSPFVVIQPKDEAELAGMVYKLLEEKGFKRSDFAKELAKLYK